MNKEPIFKIQQGQFYLQMPMNLEQLNSAKDWIEFFIDYLENQNELQQCSDEATKNERGN